MHENENETPSDFGAMLDAFEREQVAAPKHGPRVGDKVTARIVSFGEESAFVDLGGKAEGVIPLDQLTNDAGERTVELGSSVDAMVAAIEQDVVVLRVRAGRGPTAPAELAQAHANRLPVDGTVQAVVKGGVEVTVGGVRAFCPISQLDLRYVADPAVFIGQRLSFRITRYEEGRGRGANIVLSRRALLEEEAQAKAAVTRETLAVGKIVRGTITSLATYGAFVDLGGIEGLLHVSELGHGRVEHPQDVVAVGQEVEVQIQKIALDAKGNERISLSRRALVKDPWEDEATRLAPGTRRTARVARLETFGAFVELAPGIDGLLHLSELAALGGGRDVRHPRDVLQVGQSLEVAVLSIDPARRRISLALVLAGSLDEAEAAASNRPGSTPGFGAFGDFFAKSKK